MTPEQELKHTLDILAEKDERIKKLESKVINILSNKDVEASVYKAKDTSNKDLINFKQQRISELEGKLNAIEDYNNHMTKSIAEFRKGLENMESKNAFAIEAVTILELITSSITGLLK